MRRHAVSRLTPSLRTVRRAPAAFNRSVARRIESRSARAACGHNPNDGGDVMKTAPPRSCRRVEQFASIDRRLAGHRGRPAITDNSRRGILWVS